MTTFLEMKTFVREQADADPTDATDLKLSTYARLAFDDITRRKHPWGHLEVIYTFTTVPGQQAYTVAGLSVSDMEFIESVVDDSLAGGSVFFAPMTELESLYAGQTFTTDHATHFTMVNNEMWLFPTPSTARTYRVRGYRKFAAFPAGDGDEPDLPRDFHDAIQLYMLMMHYLSQEDTSTADYYRGVYEQMLAVKLNGLKSARMTHRPRIMGGRGLPVVRIEDWIRSQVEG